MTHDFSRENVAGLMDEVQSQLRNIAQLQRQRTALIGKASERGGRVTVAVNADGVLIDVKFGRGVEDLEYPELARAILKAAQDATADVMRRTQELMAPIQQDRARLPKLSDLVEGMPDVSSLMPTMERAPQTKPDARDRATVAAEDTGMTFDNVEPVEQVKPTKPGVTDSGW
ncbi:DNA-binding protein YbaB [Nocardia tenerifensis]|uniref:DNA-binding protein YbaB n=1 Tax=Nocardia tenerifensis TaxID=228006 RepID=A0A318K8M1_9NOCA|nr:YbaB/EbfC family nucleoid-associated protein [Nocardia tenerifensis]PXX66592.1 DNA-binding protein YbaB [Nocardia tenerifensis]